VYSRIKVIIEKRRVHLNRNLRFYCNNISVIFSMSFIAEGTTILSGVTDKEATELRVRNGQVDVITSKVSRSPP
jgi:hypothetical protein